jgi:methylenetetrahydrofolate reductase (NADPH)
VIAPKQGVAFREMVTGDRFFYGAELVTTRGLPGGGAGDPVRELAEACLADPRIGWISITDSPGGTPMLPPDWLAGKVAEHAAQVVVHLTCKDMNRNGLEAAAWRYAAEGFDNLLALTGDCPAAGFGGVAEPVFDLDSIGLIALLRSMNEGLQFPGRKGSIETLPKTNFFIGCAVSPFKRHERELMPQYFKLLRKIKAGAQWVIPQLGYDMRKFHEIKLLLESRRLEIPVIGNVYLLNRTVAQLFHRGKLPGCVVSDGLMNKVQRYAGGPDKGRQFFLELAAKQLAVFKGLGFASAYLGGIGKAETFAAVIDLAEGYQEGDWRDFLREIQYSQPDEFFLFQHDPVTGQCSSTEVNPQYRLSLKFPPKSKEVTLGYKVSRLVHQWAFTRGKGLYGLLVRLFRRWDKKPSVLSRLAYWLEREAKHLGYGCQDCGDCSLPDCGYLCPLAYCSKHSRNGPCGGSQNGRCELDDKECFWARVYERLKSYRESETMFSGPPTIYNAQRKHTSSWANTYLDRDHHAPPSDAASSKPSSPPGETKGTTDGD